ncbi:MAG TPA: tetratricopeptide repeat protein, partial [Rhizomicrobium sp.]
MSAKAPSAPPPGSSAPPDPFEEARQRLFPPPNNRQLAQATEALARGRADLAEPLVAHVLEGKPDDPDALNLMAGLAWREHRLAEAQELMLRCVRAAPSVGGYRFNHAVLLRRAERLDEALAELDAALAIEPGNPLFREQKASLLRQLGRLEDALALRRQLTTDYPQSPDVWLQYGN